MTRRTFLAGLGVPALAALQSRRLAVTMDDVNWRVIPQAYSSQANKRILSHLAGRGMKAGLFVVGSNVNNERGSAILTSWNDAGHMLANHTWHHRPETRSAPEELKREILACESLVGRYSQYRRFFRFPALKEGRTAEQRDAFRGVLHRRGYRNGHVTIDASDWYYDARLRAKLAADPGFDGARFRGPYVAHIVDRAEYYDNLVRRAIGRTIPHTLLIHYNLLNALFLGDVLDVLAARGWTFISTGAVCALPARVESKPVRWHARSCIAGLRTCLPGRERCW